MITASNRSYSPGIIVSRKNHYLLMDSHVVVGVCSNLDEARMCAKQYALEYHAGEIEGEDVYVYNDYDGKHIIWIEPVKRIRMSHSLGK